MGISTIDVDVDFIESMNQYRIPDKSKGLLQNCSNSVVLFSELMLGFKLYAWQVYWLQSIQEDLEQGLPIETCVLTSRQIGKSTAVAVLSLWACLFNKKPGTVLDNTIVGITSASDIQAKKLLYEMKKLVRTGDRFMAVSYKDDNGEPLFGSDFFSQLLDDDAPNNTTTISFKPYNEGLHGEYLLKGSKTGSVVKSYPPTSAVLGETFTIVIIDEAGKAEKISDQFFYDYIYPTGNSTNAARLYCSTPWVSSGFFYRLVDPDNMYGESSCRVMVFTIDAIKIENPAYYETVMKTVKQMNADGKKDEVQRAYFCRFVKGETAYFDPNKVMDAFSDEYTKVDAWSGPCDLGVDFGGQVSSKTSLTITMCTPDGIVIRLYEKKYPVGGDDNLLSDIAAVFDRFNIQRIIPDDCPQGDYLIRQMIEKGWDVHPMNFRSEKVKKYGAFRSMLNKGLIRSYEDDDLKTEMLALEYSHGKRQSVIQHAPGYSDDSIDSWLLSSYFFLVEETGFTAYDYEEVHNARSTFSWS